MNRTSKQIETIGQNKYIERQMDKTTKKKDKWTEKVYRKAIGQSK